LQRVQVLTPADNPQGKFIVYLFLSKGLLHFISSVFFTNEADFSGDGITNVHNKHQWTEENPRRKIHVRHQHHFRINVWALTMGACVVGPNVLPQRLTRKVYRNFFLYDSQ